MSYLAPTSGGLTQNHCLMAGSMVDDIRFELGISQRNDEVAMGWREPGPGLVGGTVQWGASTFGSLLSGQIKGQFG